MYFNWSLRFLSDADLTLEFNIYLRGAQAHRFEVAHPPRLDWGLWRVIPALE